MIGISSHAFRTLFFGALLAFCPIGVAQTTAQPPAPAGIPATLRAACTEEARATLGPKAVVIRCGQWTPGSQGDAVFGVPLPRAPRDPEWGRVYAKIALARLDAFKWTIEAETDESDLRNARGYLHLFSGCIRDSYGIKVDPGMPGPDGSIDPGPGATISLEYFTADGSQAKDAPIWVAWNQKAERYQLFDYSYNVFVPEDPSPMFSEACRGRAKEPVPPGKVDFTASGPLRAACLSEAHALLGPSAVVMACGHFTPGSDGDVAAAVPLPGRGADAVPFKNSFSRSVSGLAVARREKAAWKLEFSAGSDGVRDSHGYLTPKKVSCESNSYWVGIDGGYLDTTGRERPGLGVAIDVEYSVPGGRYPVDFTIEWNTKVGRYQYLRMPGVGYWTVTPEGTLGFLPESLNPPVLGNACPKAR